MPMDDWMLFLWSFVSQTFIKMMESDMKFSCEIPQEENEVVKLTILVLYAKSKSSNKQYP